MSRRSASIFDQVGNATSMAAFHIVFDVLSQSSPAHVSSLQNMPLTSNPSSAYRWSTHTCSIWLIRKTDHAFQTMHQHLRTSLNDTTQRRKAQRCMDCQQSSLGPRIVHHSQPEYTVSQPTAISGYFRPLDRAKRAGTRKSRKHVVVSKQLFMRTKSGRHRDA